MIIDWEGPEPKRTEQIERLKFVYTAFDSLDVKGKDRIIHRVEEMCGKNFREHICHATGSPYLLLSHYYKHLTEEQEKALESALKAEGGEST